MAKMPSVYGAAQPVTEQLLAQQTRSAPAVAIPLAGHIAWKAGVRNPMTRAAHALWSAPMGSPDYMRGLKALVHPEHDPTKMISYLRGLPRLGPQLGRSWNTLVEAAKTSPKIAPWVSLGPLTRARQLERAGRAPHLGGGYYALPGMWRHLWGQKAPRIFETLPEVGRQAWEARGAPKYPTILSMLTQAVRGGDATIGEILQKILGAAAQ